MVSILELRDDVGNQFVDRFEAAGPLVGSCLASNIGKVINAYQYFASAPKLGEKYIKLHHYALVSSVVDTLGVLAANDFSVDKDDDFRAALDVIKMNLALSSFNGFFSSFPIAPFHGQDALLFRAIEFESLAGGVSIFDYRRIRVQLGEALLNDLSYAAEYENFEDGESSLGPLFGDLFLDEVRLRSVDFLFNSIMASCETQAQRASIIALEQFMKSIPEDVYHCHNGKTIYSNRGFLLSCDCGRSHLIDECEAVCDGGAAHFAVFRSSCGKTLSKVVSEGVFRVKGVKIVSKFTANNSLIDLAEQAIASRKVVT